MIDNLFRDAFAGPSSLVGARRGLNQRMATTIFVDHFDAHLEASMRRRRDMDDHTGTDNRSISQL